MKIIDYGFVGDDRTSVRIYTEGGGIITAKRCPLPERLTCSGSYPHRGTIASKPALYCTRDGHFLSLTKLGLREIKPCYSPGMQNNKGGSCYPKLTQLGTKLCHHLMYETWVGPRTKGMEIDHINGDKCDWSLANLEEVTPAENRKRAKILRAMRAAGNDPCKYTAEQLREIFRKFEVVSPERIMDRDFSGHREGIL